MFNTNKAAFGLLAILLLSTLLTTSTQAYTQTYLDENPYDVVPNYYDGSDPGLTGVVLRIKRITDSQVQIDYWNPYSK